MAMKFIKVTLIHPSNIEGDCNVYLNTAVITSVLSASSLDKKHRNECNSIIYASNGLQYGVSEKAEDIVNQLESIVD